MKKIAIYARVSTIDRQDLDTQLLPLREYAKMRGFTIFKEYVDKMSWSKENRPNLNLLMNDVKKRKIDWVLVFRFDRFSRSTRHLINTLELFNSIWVDFISYNENIDTSTPVGKVLFTMIWAFAEFERSIIRERVKAGIIKARAKGVILGRPKIYADKNKIVRLKESWLSFRQIADKLKLKKSNVYSIYKKQISNKV